MTDTNVSKVSTYKKVVVVGFGPRLLATLIDGAMISFFGFMLAFVIGMIGMFTNMIRTGQDTGVLELLILSCVLLFSIVYYVGFWTASGQTMGMTVVGLRVVGTDGERLSTGKALLRYLGYIISAILFSIGFLWAAFDPKRQGWHDKLAGTLVVYAETDFTAADDVDYIPSDYDRKGWIWAVLWVIAALFSPIGALAGLLTVGPFITKTLVTLIQSIF